MKLLACMTFLMWHVMTSYVDVILNVFVRELDSRIKKKNLKVLKIKIDF